MMILDFFRLAIGRWQISLGIAAALAGCLALAYCQGRSDGAASLRAEQAEAATRIVQQARNADAAGVGVAQAENDAVARSNQAARDAAAGSDDPLADGLRALNGDKR